MALLQIIPCTDPLLLKPSARIEEITPEIKWLAADMIETMLAVDGAGLAAVQVAVPVAMFVMIDLPGATALPQREHLAYADKRVLINPRMVDHSDDLIHLPEGCLSMPGVFYPIPRYREVTFAYTDLNGVEQTITGKGYKGVALQHEMDHLDGIRNIDRLSRLKRERALKKYRDHVLIERAMAFGLHLRRPGPM